MLRFVRPWRTPRTVWVDALCINQKNIQERNHQVPQIGQIYRNCLRVVVFLGSDLAASSVGGFAPRRKLTELETETSTLSKTQTDLKSLLERRYFSRIWIVQELVMAPQAVFRIEGRDYWVNQTVAEELVSQNSLRPWFQFVTRGTSPCETIVEAMKLTANSSATDIRDDIFGVLSLVDDTDERETLQPDYSLSPKHVFIGFFAYCLIYLGDWTVLVQARGLQPDLTLRDASPSWTPLWESSITKSRMHNPSNALYDRESFAMLSTQFESITRANQGYFLNLTGSRLIVQSEKMIELLRPAFVESGTAALSISVTHLCQLSHKPARLYTISGFSSFEVRSGDSAIQILSQHHLGEMLSPHTDHLFIFEEPKYQELLFLILRQINSSTFSLVACTPFVNFTSTKLMPNSLELGNLQRSVYDELKALRSHLSERRSDITQPPPEYPPKFGHSPGWKWYLKPYCFFVLFPQAQSGWNVLSACHTLMMDQRHGTTSRAFAAFLSTDPSTQRYDGATTVVTNDYWIASFDKVYEPHRLDDLGFLCSDVLSWEFSIGGSASWHRITAGPDLSVRLSYKIHRKLQIRTPLPGIREWLQSYAKGIMEVVSRLQKVLKIDLDEVFKLIRNGPNNEHHAIGFPVDFGGDILTDFDIDGSTQRIRIV